MNRDYCACIRTLGKAGVKYQTLLDSLKSQTVKAKKILVYIPYGYELPKETIGIEQYVRCEKGMVSQRALPFDEVNTEWILFLDDDLYIPEDGVEKLFIGLEDNNGDSISPDIYSVQNMSFGYKVLSTLLSLTPPRKDDGWAFKIQGNGQYTYNNAPRKKVLPTQSAAGACILMRKNVYESIHFQDELWMDSFRYAIGDDLLFSYKIYICGFRELIHYDAGFVHLDAQSGRVSDDRERYFLGQIALTVVWYRACYALKNESGRYKMKALLSYILISLWKLFTYAVPRSCKYHNFNSIIDYIRAKIHAYRFVHSTTYRSIPYFNEYSR